MVPAATFPASPATIARAFTWALVLTSAASVVSKLMLPSSVEKTLPAGKVPFPDTFKTPLALTASFRIIPDSAARFVRYSPQLESAKAALYICSNSISVLPNSILFEENTSYSNVPSIFDASTLLYSCSSVKMSVCSLASYTYAHLPVHGGQLDFHSCLCAFLLKIKTVHAYNIRIYHQAFDYDTL